MPRKDAVNILLQMIENNPTWTDQISKYIDQNSFTLTKSATQFFIKIVDLPGDDTEVLKTLLSKDNFKRSLMNHYNLFEQACKKRKQNRAKVIYMSGCSRYMYSIDASNMVTDIPALRCALEAIKGMPSNTCGWDSLLMICTTPENKISHSATLDVLLEFHKIIDPTTVFLRLLSFKDHARTKKFLLDNPWKGTSESLPVENFLRMTDVKTLVIVMEQCPCLYTDMVLRDCMQRHMYIILERGNMTLINKFFSYFPYFAPKPAVLACKGNVNTTRWVMERYPENDMCETWKYITQKVKHEELHVYLKVFRTLAPTYSLPYPMMHNRQASFHEVWRENFL